MIVKEKIVRKLRRRRKFKREKVRTKAIRLERKLKEQAKDPTP